MRAVWINGTRSHRTVHVKWHEFFFVCSTVYTRDGRQVCVCKFMRSNCFFFSFLFVCLLRCEAIRRRRYTLKALIRKSCRRTETGREREGKGGEEMEEKHFSFSMLLSGVEKKVRALFQAGHRKTHRLATASACGKRSARLHQRQTMVVHNIPVFLSFFSLFTVSHLRSPKPTPMTRSLEQCERHCESGNR